MRRALRALRIPLLVVLIGITVYLFIAHRKQGTRGAVSWGTLEGERPWLGEVNAWSETMDLARGTPALADLGGFPLGNGRVFTTLGLVLPVNTLENTVGPTYQKQAGFLGSESITVRVNGRPERLTAQKAESVRHAGVLRTTCGGTSCVLYTADFIPPDLDAIIRLIAVKNISKRPIRVEVGISFGGLPLERPGREPVLSRGSIRIVAGMAGGEARWRKANWVATGEGLRESSRINSAEGYLSVPFGTIAPGQGRAKAHYLAVATDVQKGRAIAADAAQQAVPLLDGTRKWWNDWYTGTTTVSCAEPAVSDLLETEKRIIRTQQAEGGGYSPMYQYTFCWARDSNGPVRYMLRVGKFEEVKRYLDFYFRACAVRKAIRMNNPLDLVVSGALPEVDWSHVPVERAEAPSLLVLQHYWYWRYTGDLEPITSHWPYLERCLEGQALSPDLRLPFHGDETYRFPGYEIFHATKKIPTDYLSLDLYSADSAYEYVAAATGLAEMARARGDAEDASKWGEVAADVRAATDQWYWTESEKHYAAAMSTFSGERYPYPFACIDTSPLWVGYAGANDPRANASALNGISYLWRDNGTLDTTPSFGYGVGMTPGMLLWNLAAVDHPDAEKAFRGVLAAFSPSGGMAEMLTPENTPAEQYWGKTRIRPWEGGINAEAVLYYLSGFEPDAQHMSAKLCPRLPHGWTRMGIENMRLVDNRLSLWVQNEEHRVIYQLQNNGPKPVRIELTASLPPCDITAVVGSHLAPGAGGIESPGRTENGRTHCLLEGEIPANGRAKVLVGYRPNPAAAIPHIRRRPFVYPKPAVGDATAVLVTWDSEMARKWRAREPRLFVMDTRIAFPPEYLENALFQPGRSRRRVDHAVLDVSTFPGAFRTPAYWTTGPGGRILNAFESMGGRITREPGRRKPADLFGD